MKTICATGIFLLVMAMPASSQTSDLLSDREIVETVVGGFIAETMAGNCGNVIMTPKARLELTQRADELAIYAGRTPDEARAEISTPANASALQALILRDMGRMGIPDGDITALCRVAGEVAGNSTMIGQLLTPAR